MRYSLLIDDAQMFHARTGSIDHTEAPTLENEIILSARKLNLLKLWVESHSISRTAKNIFLPTNHYEWLHLLSLRIAFVVWQHKYRTPRTTVQRFLYFNFTYYTICIEYNVERWASSVGHENNCNLMFLNRSSTIVSAA